LGVGSGSSASARLGGSSHFDARLGSSSDVATGLSIRSRFVNVQSQERLAHGKSSKQPPNVDPFLLSKQSNIQPKIKSTCQGLKAKTKLVGMTKFMTFNVILVDSPYYHGMIREIVETGPTVQGPTPYEISHGYLDMEMEDYLKTFQNLWDEYGTQ